jgi:membrane protein CcdC involved in cytochrome C biogenesis
MEANIINIEELITKNNIFSVFLIEKNLFEVIRNVIIEMRPPANNAIQTALVISTVMKNSIIKLFNIPIILKVIFFHDIENNEKGNKTSRISESIFLCEKPALIL